MAWAYWKDGRTGETAVFDYFFRRTPFGGGYAVFAGWADLLEALKAFRFDEEAIAFLRSDGFGEDFLDYLRSFQFNGRIDSVAEGEIIFPQEPVARVEGGLVEAQLIETLVLNVLNFQTLIATKAARCREAAGARLLSEFGLRRAQGLGGIWGSRAACIGGCDSTSNMLAAQRYGLRAAGTMAHAFVQSYGDELEAFRKYADLHGSNTVLLLDTYDTLESGLPNALTVARELEQRGEELFAVRLDSGELGELARHVRRELDRAGLGGVKIVASNELDEYRLADLLQDGAPIDVFGIGTALATGKPDAALDGVYKLAMVNEQPCIKTSEAPAKTTLPGRKAVARFFDNGGTPVIDLIHLEDEPVPESVQPKNSAASPVSVSGLQQRGLLKTVYDGGKPMPDLPGIGEIAESVRERLAAFPPKYRRLTDPALYPVALGSQLGDLRDQLSTPATKESLS